MHRYQSCTSSRGFHLIELIIVVAIIAILAGVALPAYNDYITRANRNVAKTALLDAASRLETWRLDNKTYVLTTDATDLGYPAATVYYDRDGQYSAAGDAVYLIQNNGAFTANTFSIEAVPQNAQAANDTECATFRLNESGVKSINGGTSTADECW